MSETISRFGGDFRINPDAPDGHIEAKWPDPDLGVEVLSDHGKYFRPEIADAEWENLWAQTWNLAGRVSDVPNVGDFFKFDLGPESFIVVRTADGIRAFYNVCPHRGARIVLKEFGKTSNFVCLYHSWSWKLDGSLARITDRETFDEATLCGNLNLVEVACDTWGGFVFINMMENPRPLAEFLDVLPDHLAPYRFEEMAVVADICVEWNANWKVALDAFMEGYHVHVRHPEALGFMDEYHCQRDMFANGHGRLLFPVGLNSPRAADPDKLSQDLREMLEDFGLDPKEFEGNASAARAAIQNYKRVWAAAHGLDYDRFTDSQLSDDWNYSIFPNVTFNIHCDNALMMRFRPHPTDPDKCLYDVLVLAMPVSDPDYRLPRYMGLPPDLDLSVEIPRPERVHLKHGEASLGLVLDQDSEMVPFVQQGVKSRAFKGVRLSKQEIRMRHFYAEYDRYLKGERS